jgi:hypothetical protein
MLHHINGKQASYLLSKLVRRGLLVKMGIGGRGAFYTLNEYTNIRANLLENPPEMEKDNHKDKKITPSNIEEKSQQIKETKSEQSIQLQLDLFKNFDNQLPNTTDQSILDISYHWL